MVPRRASGPGDAAVAGPHTPGAGATGRTARVVHPTDSPTGDGADGTGGGPVAPRYSGSPWLLVRGLPRDPRASAHLTAMLVSTVATVLLVRGLLALAGYPRLGGGGLHIAHVLWGGLLMMLATVLFVSFMGPVIRPIASVLAGVGAGLFLDEIGKFVTSDNDYFYRPAPAIMYAIVVALVLLAHGLHGRRPHHPSEHLAGAVDQAVAGVVGGLTPYRRARVEEQLRLAGSAAGAAETRALIRATPDDPVELFDPLRFVDPWQWFAQLQRVVRERRHPGRFVPSITVAVLVLEIIYGAVYFGTALDARLGGAALPGERAGIVPVLLGLVSTAVSTLFVVLGLRHIRGDRYLAFSRFQQALLVNLLFTRVFEFDVDRYQLPAIGPVLVDVALLAVVTAERARLMRLIRQGAPARSPEPADTPE